MLQVSPFTVRLYDALEDDYWCVICNQPATDAATGKGWCISRLLITSFRARSVYIVTELCKGGDLDGLLKVNAHCKPFTVLLVCEFC